MSIARPKTPPKSIEEFIDRAPDAPARRGVIRGKKEQISVTLEPEQVERLTEFARSKRISRAAAIAIAIDRLLESGL